MKSKQHLLRLVRRAREHLIILGVGFAALSSPPLETVAASRVIAWGSNYYGQTSVPASASNTVAIAAGNFHSMALKGDGTVLVWGDNSYGQRNVLPGLSNVVAIAAYGDQCLALKADGTVAGWGKHVWPPSGVNSSNLVPASLANVVAIAGRNDASLALTAEGRIVQWAYKDVPASLTNLTGAVAVAGGDMQTLAIKSNRQVAAWGRWDLGYGYSATVTVPTNLANVIAVGGGNSHSVALKADGTLTVWGRNHSGGETNVPAGLSNIVSMAVAHGNSLVLRANGSVAGWGSYYAVTNIPSGLTNVIALSAGATHGLALVGDGSPTITIPPASQMVNEGGTAIFDARVVGSPPLSYQWQFNGADVPGATGVTLVVTNLQLSDAGSYAMMASNALGVAVSKDAWLIVIPDEPLIIVQPVSRTNSAGSVATFTVSAVATSLLSYQWRKGDADLVNSGNISGVRTPTLTLSNVLHADVGDYLVVLNNAYGSVTSQVARLTVVEPAITTQPTGWVAHAGQTITLKVSAAGTPPLSYQWRKDGVGLDSASASSLVLTNVQWADRGGYDVVVTNAYGAATSTVAYLTINLATVDSFNPGIAGVECLAVQPDGRILLGGNFSLPGGATCVGRLNADGMHDAGFSSTANGGLICLGLQPDARILAGGAFSGLNGQPRSYLGRLDPNGLLDASFDIAADNPVGYCSVRCLAAQADGRVLVGGYFTTLDGQARSYLGRLNSDGSLDPSFSPLANNSVECLAVQPDGKILVGGGFTSLCGQPRSRIGRLNPDGTLDLAFNPSASANVQALAVQVDGRILVGGAFTNLAGQARVGIARLQANGTPDPGFNAGISGSINNNLRVRAIVVQTDGKALVGGYFTSLGGSPRRCLGCLAPDGTVDQQFDPAPSGYVSCLALQTDGQVLVAGGFTSLAGQSRNGIGRLNNPVPASESLTVDTSTITWLRGGSSPEVWYTSFDVSTNGNDWTNLGRGTRISGGWHLAGVSVPPGSTLRARGWVVGGSSWFVERSLGAPSVSVQPDSRTNNAGTVASFYALAAGASPLGYQWLKNGTALNDGGNVSGARTPTLTLGNVLGADAGGYAIIITNAEGSVTSQVAVLSVVDPVITSQPSHQTVNRGQTARLAVTALGTAPLHYTWRKEGTNLPGATLASLTLANAQWQNVGRYDAVVSSPFGSVTSAVSFLTVNLATPDSFSAGTDAEYVHALAVQSDGRILVGGYFTTLGGQPRNNAGRLYAGGSLDASFNPQTDYEVYCWSLPPDGTTLVGGSFATFAGADRRGLARLKADGTLDSSFNPGADSSVVAILTQTDGKILVSGGFSTIADHWLNSLARLNANGSLDAGFNPGFGLFWADCLMVQSDGRILVAGNTGSYVNSAPFYRLNADGALDPGFTPEVGGVDYASVTALALQPDGRMVIGGNFVTVNGQPRNRLGRLNADGTTDPTFNPGMDGTNYPYPSVYSVALQADGKILVGGSFSSFVGQTRSNIARLNVDGTLDGTFNPGADGPVRSLALQADGRILVGGGFTKLGGVSRSYLARLNNTDPATQTLSCHGSNIAWLRGGTSPEIWRCLFQYSTNGTTWVNLGAGTHMPGGWQVTGVSVPANATVRARGFASGGMYNASSWFVESSIVTRAPVILTQPLSRTNNAGTEAVFTVEAGGTPTLLYQWRFNGTDLPGATAGTLTLGDVQENQQGLYSVVVSNAFGWAPSANAAMVVNQPPVADASASQLLYISVNGTNAKVILNGTRSSDPDGDLLHYLWLSTLNPHPSTALASGVVAVVVLPVGTHSLWLVVNDDLLTDTNAFTVEVLTAAQAVERLASAVELDVSRSRPLLATLSAALASIDRSNPVSAINQLLAFQNKVRAQVMPLDAALADSFIQTAQAVIDVLSGGAMNPGGRPHGRFTSVTRHRNGWVQMVLSAERGGVHILQASTNLADWEMIGVAAEQADGSFGAEDPNAGRFPNRFYRVVSP